MNLWSGDIFGVAEVQEFQFLVRVLRLGAQ